MREDPFVDRVERIGRRILDPPLEIDRHAALLYQVTVDNQLQVSVDPSMPKRGQSAFQTDLLVFERLSEKVRIPRVVLEFKTGLTTHDILTYTTKARKHKQVYPYLRYGILCSRDRVVPRRFFTHNEALDFCIAAGSVSDRNLSTVIGDLFEAEVEASRLMEDVAFGRIDANVFRSEPTLRRRTRTRRQ